MKEPWSDTHTASRRDHGPATAASSSARSAHTTPPRAVAATRGNVVSARSALTSHAASPRSGTPDSGRGLPHPTRVDSSRRPSRYDDPERIVNGTVTVRRDELTVIDPVGLGSFATITVPDDDRVTVTIGHQRVVGEVFVSRDHYINIQLKRTVPKREVSISASADKMSVTMTLSVSPGAEYHLEPSDPSNHLELQLREEVILPPTGAIEPLLAKLADTGFRGQIDHVALREIAASRTSLTLVIMRGTPPVRGRPIHYRLLPVCRQYDRMHRRMRFAHVEVGTVVALSEPELPAVPGYNVVGEELQAPAPPVLPILGTGVTNVHGRVVATRAGRLAVSRSAIQVLQEWVIHGDVGGNRAPVLYDGDVTIHGSVLEGASVKATGVVTIDGNVIAATVTSERGVCIDGHVTQSTVLAGMARQSYDQLRQLLNAITADLERFRADYETVLQHAKLRADYAQKISTLAAVLLEKRYQTLDQQLKSLATSQGHLEQRESPFRTMVQLGAQKWIRRRAHLSLGDIDELIRSLDNYRTDLDQSFQHEAAYVRTGSVTSSAVQASGNIVVRGKGVVSSSLETSGSIVIQASVRGGFLVAERAIRANVFGATQGTETSARVRSPRGYAQFATCHANTLVEIGEVRHKNTTEQSHTRFRGTK